MNWLDEVSWDDKGLIPVIAQEASSGDVLMFAWMNREALQKTAELGQAVYYSRSRGRLWHKGEESGNQQTVHEPELRKVIRDGVGCCATLIKPVICCKYHAPGQQWPDYNIARHCVDCAQSVFLNCRPRVRLLPPSLAPRPLPLPCFDPITTQSQRALWETRLQAQGIFGFARVFEIPFLNGWRANSSSASPPTAHQSHPAGCIAR